MDQITRYRLNSAEAEKRIEEWASGIDPTLRQQIGLANWMAEQAAQKGHMPTLKDALQLVAALTKQARLEAMKTGELVSKSAARLLGRQLSQAVQDVLGAHNLIGDGTILEEIRDRTQLLIEQMKDPEVLE